MRKTCALMLHRGLHRSAARRAYFVRPGKSYALSSLAVRTPDVMEPLRTPSEVAADAPTRLELRVGFSTDTGPRERNEDYAAFYASSREQQARLGAMAAIADGVGGTKG